MKLNSIWTLRRLQHQVFRQIVEEWEDDFSKELGLPLQDMSICETRANGRVGNILRRLPRAITAWDDGGRWQHRRANGQGLGFLLWPPAHPASFWVQPDVVPVVIDFWRHQLPDAERVFARSPHIFVTNQEIKRDLAATALASRVKYLPLSVSARHVQASGILRTTDLIQVGRQNPRLHEWALEYVRLRPGAKYLYADTSGTWPCWTATDRGRLEIDTSRASYWQLLRSSRISLVSAPGIDGGEKRTGGYNPVTPRFYESAAARCHLVGRFPKDGADFVFNRVASACSHVDTFDEFAAVVDQSRKTPPDVTALDAFLVGHTTAEVARSLRSVLSTPGKNLSA
jgi:hypothetical protein